MPRNLALVVSGAVTAFMLVVVIGLIAGANWVNQNVEAATPAVPVQVTDQTVQAPAASGQDAAEIANLQAQTADLQTQVTTYRSQLQQAVDALQAAYDQIAVMQQQQAFPNAGDNTGGIERGRTSNRPFSDD